MEIPWSVGEKSRIQIRLLRHYAWRGGRQTDRPATGEEPGIRLYGTSPDRGRFFGPDAEAFEGEGALARRIQVVSDLAVLYKLLLPAICRRDGLNQLGLAGTLPTRLEPPFQTGCFQA